jgi:uncharacterized protein
MLLVRTSLRPSPIHGLGVFADEFIAQGQLVWEFDRRIDIVIPLAEIASFPPAQQEYISMLDYVEVLDGQKVMILCADNAKHINHSDAPNVVDTADNRQQYAARDIQPGEELTCDYFAYDLEADRKLGRFRTTPGAK